jgi:hypothetical protein
MSYEAGEPEQVDLTKANNDVELLALAPAVFMVKTKSFFSRYQQFFYGVFAGAAITVAGRYACCKKSN